MTLANVLVACALALPVAALADDTAKTTTKTTDKTTQKLTDNEIAVVAHVHHVNQVEIDLGKTAQKQGTAAVKKYGEMLVKDHTAADKDLVALAKKHGLAKIPEDKPVTEAETKEQKEMMDAVAALKKQKGADFEKTFLTMMVSDHEKEITKVDAALLQCSDDELKTMLAGMKPTLQKHADQARDLQKGNAQASK
jgi:putative membrane protein